VDLWVYGHRINQIWPYFIELGIKLDWEAKCDPNGLY